MDGFAAVREGRIAHCTMVTMRDGVRLATTVCLPPGEGPFPVVLVRTAYNRAGSATMAYARRGLALVVQDVRGRYESEGDYWPFVNERDDGVDTLRWLHTQPWCDGRIGMTGASYLAAVQQYAGPAAPELLTTLNPCFMGVDLWAHTYWRSGAFSLGLTWSWLCFECAGRVSTASLLPFGDTMAQLRHLPLETLDVVTIGREVPSYRDYVGRWQNDAVWQELSLDGQYGRFTMPMLLVGGWYDYYPAASATFFRELRRTAPDAALASRHRLLLGPWTHGINGSSALGDVDFGPAALAENDIAMRWLDCLLHGGDPAAVLPAPVRFFTTGLNRWQDAADWPPSDCREQRWYLHSGGAANTRDGDGTLSREPPGDEPDDRFRYDPEKPVPTLGGNHSIGPYNPGLYEHAPPGPRDQAPIERRDDVLVYTSAPLTADLEMTGPILVHLIAASSAPDTDFVARLCDVDPEGRSINLAEGILRARYRHGLKEPLAPLPKNEAVALTIDLHIVSHRFLAGHRLRLDLTSSSYPLWDRNLNTGENPATGTRWAIADQRIRHRAGQVSWLSLPVRQLAVG